MMALRIFLKKKGRRKIGEEGKKWNSGKDDEDKELAESGCGSGSSINPLDAHMHTQNMPCYCLLNHTPNTQ